MGRVSGESDIYFGTDVGQWGAEGAGNVFLGRPKEERFFSITCAYNQNALDGFCYCNIDDVDLCCM